MTSAALEVLGSVATEARIGPAAAKRMAEVVRAVGPDLAEVEALLAESARTGAVPGTQAAAHLLGAGGKRIRPVALLLASSIYARPNRAAHELAAVAELVHAATLLHDDVIDDAPERRGQPAARTVWGNAVSVLGGDLMLTHALSRCHAVGNARVFEHLLQTLRTLVDGEIVQLRGRTAIDLRAETYFHIAHAKTASLFDWATTAGARIAGAPEADALALGRFGVNLGLAFQLVDDVLDYDGLRESTGKALFTDLREGKVTLPLVYAIERDPSLARVVQAIRDGDEIAAGRLGPAIVATDACDRVRSLAHEHTRKALAELATLPSGEPRDLLAAVATDLVSRLR
jgi:octaprenyl-diphosphate synthase